MCGNTGPQMGGWFTKELTSVESYKGLRYRMPGIGGDVLRRLGAVVVNVPPGEIIASLKSGAIDASEFAGPWVDMAVGLHKAAKYYYYPGFHEPGAALSLVVNKKLWDGFGSAERSIIETAAAAENANSYAEFTANDAVALQQLAADPAIQIRKLDDSILQALGKLSGEVLFETGRKDDLTRRVYESFIKFRTASVRWGDISERAFLNARALSYPFGDDGRVGIGVVGGKAAAMSLVSSSPSAKTHSPKVREWAPLRLGVASRLLLAFLGISGLAVVGAGVAILSFRDISDVLDSITARRVPAALALQEVSRQAERIASAAPALLDAATPADHAESSRKIAVEMRELAQLLEGLEHRGADDVALGSMRSAVSHLRVNLESLDKLVADRMVVSELKRGQLRNALFAHRREPKPFDALAPNH
jgi:hypothetical protein